MDKKRRKVILIRTAIVALVLFALCLGTSGPAQAHVLRQSSENKWSRADQTMFAIVYWPVIVIANSSDSAMRLFVAYVSLCGEDSDA
jgi:hypothetical protein